MIQGNMFNPRQSYRKPSGQQRGLTSLFYPAGSQQPNLQTSARRSPMPNPIAPAAAEAQANAQFMQVNPGYGTSSLDATQRAGNMTMYNPFQASMVNGYVGQYGQAAAPGRPGAQGPTVFDPTNLAARFGGAPAVSQATLDANARMARTQSSDALLAGKLASGQTIDSTAQGGTYAKRTADGGMAYTNRAGAVEGSYPDLRNPMMREGALQQLSTDNPGLYRAYTADQEQRAAKAKTTADRAQKFKDEHGGMSARQFGIQSRQDKREQARFKRDVMRGLNPMSPQAMALHPNAAKMFQQGGAKTTMQNPIAPGKARTTQSMTDADTVMTSLATADPFISSLGARGKDDTSIASVNAGLQGLKDSGVQPSPEHLRSLRAYAQAVKHRAAPGRDPWDVYAPQVYDELVSMPDDATDEDLTKWWEKYKQRPNMGDASKAGPPAGNMPYFPPGTPIGR